ncbi:hypothetical protein QFC21_007256 [Naganishia friedmannii]|uniref:Uncharacterized protein n=1 Tax=Naganishia friedmannii TaxID=89922 RepID=A0ACC2UXT9_9TREE|nr:hypothetical protein QFC21_007256 [Naganishia friedmannii]
MTLTDADAQDDELRKAWVKDVRTAAAQVSATYASDSLKAKTIKGNVGSETRAVINPRIKDKTVEALLEALRLLDDEDTDMIATRSQTNRAADTVAGMRAELTRMQQMMQQIRVTGGGATGGAVGTMATTGQRTQGGTNSAPTGGWAPVTPELQRRIDEYLTENKGVRADVPFPQMPGTEAPGSGECFGCGIKGHSGAFCTRPKLPKPDQEHRFAVHMATRGRGAAAQTMRPTTVIPARMANPATDSNSEPINGPARFTYLEDEAEAGNGMGC